MIWRACSVKRSNTSATRLGLRRLDVENPELQGAARRGDLDRLALLAPEDRLPDRRFVRELVPGGIGLGGADDVVLDRLPRVDVLELHARTDGDGVRGDLRGVEHACLPEPLEQHRDPALEQGLLVLRVVVFGVLADVAELARDADAVGDLAALLAGQVVDLLLELLVAVGGEDDLVHGLRLPFKKERREARRHWIESYHRYDCVPSLYAGKSSRALVDRAGRDPDPRRPRADGRRERAGVPPAGPPLRRGARLLGDG